MKVKWEDNCLRSEERLDLFQLVVVRFDLLLFSDRAAVDIEDRRTDPWREGRAPIPGHLTTLEQRQAFCEDIARLYGCEVEGSKKVG